MYSQWYKLIKSLFICFPWVCPREGRKTNYYFSHLHLKKYKSQKYKSRINNIEEKKSNKVIMYP